MSLTLVACPYCQGRVVPNNGICPACNANLNDEAAVRREALRQAASETARKARAQGASYGEIETQLVQAGADEALTREIMAQVEGRTPEAMAHQNEQAKRQGLYWLVGGVLVTAITYGMAASSEKGGYYILAWGPMVFGGLQFLRSLLRSKGR